MLAEIDANSSSRRILSNDEKRDLNDGNIDCGIQSLGWCRSATCRNYARLNIFVIILAVTGILQGISERYFRVTIKHYFKDQNDPMLVDWILISGGIIQALCALPFSFYAYRFHPISWLSGTILLQTSVVFITQIPALIETSSKSDVINISTCSTQWPNLGLDNQRFSTDLTEKNTQLLTVILFFVLQFALRLASLAFYTIGFVYVDDNANSFQSVLALSAVLAAKIFGLHLGFLLSSSVIVSSFTILFGWILMIPIYGLCAILLGLFPRHLLYSKSNPVALKFLLTDNNMEIMNVTSTCINDPAFVSSIHRLLQNKLLIYLVTSVMFIGAAIINFDLFEENYVKSRFLLAYNENDGFIQEWRLRFLSIFMREPAAVISVIIAGIIIIKMKFNARYLTIINIIMNSILLVSYMAFIFVQCDLGHIAGMINRRFQQPYCSRQCICSTSIFEPVCPENSTTTYISPCFAGCKRLSLINDNEIFEDCTCIGSNKHDLSRARNGACMSVQCHRLLIVFQLLSITVYTVLGIMTVSRLILILRSVSTQDKSLTLALVITLTGFFTYIPIYIIYKIITKWTCLYWTSNYDRCLLYSNPLYGNIINGMTICLVLMALVFDLLFFTYNKSLNIFSNDVNDNDEYTIVNQNEESILNIATTTNNILTNNDAIMKSKSSSTSSATNTEIKLRKDNSPLVLKHRTTLYKTNSFDSNDIDLTRTEPITNNNIIYTQIDFHADELVNHQISKQSNIIKENRNKTINHTVSNSSDLLDQVNSIKFDTTYQNNSIKDIRYQMSSPNTFQMGNNHRSVLVIQRNVIERSNNLNLIDTMEKLSTTKINVTNDEHPPGSSETSL